MGALTSVIGAAAHHKLLASCPRGHPDRALHCAYIAASLKTLYHKSKGRQIALLDAAIIWGRDALSECRHDDPLRETLCTNLAVCLTTRADTWDRHLDDLPEAVQFSREALVLCPSGHENHVTSAIHVTILLEKLFEKKNDISLVYEAVPVARNALDLCSPDHPERAMCCRRLASLLNIQYRHISSAALLDEAVQLEREALALCPAGHPDRAMCCTNLATSLCAQHYLTSDAALIDEAIKLGREALALRPTEREHHSDSCANLAAFLGRRYEQTGDSALLDEMFNLNYEAFISSGPISRSSYYTSSTQYWRYARNLATSLRICGEQTGDGALIKAAVEWGSSTSDPTDPHYATICADVAASLAAHYPYLAKLWRKVVKPVLDHLQLKVCERSKSCLIDEDLHIYLLGGYWSSAAPSVLVLYWQVCLPSSACCRHL
jgi:hypothetical protein